MSITLAQVSGHETTIPALVHGQSVFELTSLGKKRKFSLRRFTDIGEGDEGDVLRYEIFLNGRELNICMLLDGDEQGDYMALPYEVPKAELCPENVPSELLRRWVLLICIRYLLHRHQSKCFLTKEESGY